MSGRRPALAASAGALALLCLAPRQAASASYAVDCRLTGPGGDLDRLSPVRVRAHHVRLAVNDKLFVELKYDAEASTVSFRVIEAPHAPWTFGERDLEPERTLQIRPGAPASVPVDALAPGARLDCEPPP